MSHCNSDCLIVYFLFIFFIVFFFFFKQKTAYEIGTGDWSSDVCSSDLLKLYGSPVFRVSRTVD